MDHVDKIQAQWNRELPGMNLSGQSLIARIHRLANHLAAEITSLYREFGLSEGEFDILCALRREGPPFEVRPADISKTTMVTTGGTSKRLDRLESAGLVERLQSADDGRGRIVRLTSSGLELINRAFTAHIENENRLVSELSVQDRNELEALLRKWLRVYEEGI